MGGRVRESIPDVSIVPRFRDADGAFAVSLSGYLVTLR